MSRTKLTLRRLSAAVPAIAIAATLLASQRASAQTEIRSRDLAPNNWTGASTLPATAGTQPTWWNQTNTPWRLGVAIENLETGVLLTDVERGLPAAAAGLKRGDVIISIGGYQVGYVNGALFDLGDELRRRVDDNGRVTMLTFDAQNRQLRSLPVNLMRSTGKLGVRGQVLCRERITLTTQAVLTVRLRDVTFPNWQNVSVGEAVIPNPSHPPIEFGIDFDPSTIYADHRYAVDAWLVDRGQVVLQSAPVTVNPLATAPIVPLQITLVRAGNNAATQPPNVYASGQIDQINGWYRQYLLRDATTQELAAWQSHLQAGRSVQDVQAFILSSSEYYDRMGNQSGRYLSELYRTLYGRQPTASELAQFQGQYQQYGGARTLFVQEALRRIPGR